MEKNIFKRTVLLFIALILLSGICGCGKDSDADIDDYSDETEISDTTEFSEETDSESGASPSAASKTDSKNTEAPKKTEESKNTSASANTAAPTAQQPMGKLEDDLAKVSSAKYAVNTDNWTGEDGLGRSITPDSVKSKQNNKYVGMFFWDWNYQWATSIPARNITEIISQYPEAKNDYDHKAWNNTAEGIPYFWDEPIYGYYRCTDTYVIRKQAELLADAGVDVIIFDCTNGTELFIQQFKQIINGFTDAKSQGVNVPKFSFLLNFAPNDNTRRQLKSLYSKVYKNGLYKDLWFYWEGKPLIMAYPSALVTSEPEEKEISEFFTFRKGEPSYFAYANELYSECKWGWLSVYPQPKFGIREDGTVEEMTVGVAQNATTKDLVAMNAKDVLGRGSSVGEYSYSFTYKGTEKKISSKTEKAYLYGVNFQQQWDRAISINPDFVFVTGWNEWIAGRYKEWGGAKNGFPDEFSPEFSRDIEPSAGILKDHFYNQLVYNIRSYKGMNKSAATGSSKKTIDIHGDISQWKSVDSDFYHYTDSTQERQCKGYVGFEYAEEKTRNDVVLTKAAYDNNYVYLLAVTKEALSSQTDKNWMRLLIDTDPTGKSPSWEGYEYIVNRTSPKNGKASVEKASGSGFSWKGQYDADISVNGRFLQIKIPRASIGLSGSGKPAFSFKWADNNLENGDIMTLYTKGEAAPGARFNFSFR